MLLCIPIEAEDNMRSAYTQLHTVKAEMDQMEEMPRDLKTVYDKMMKTLNTISDAIQDAQQVRMLMRRYANKARR